MVMLIILHVVKSLIFLPSLCVEIVLRFAWIKALADDAPFDICSCQFAMHYSCSAETRAQRALANVSALLRPKVVCQLFQKFKSSSHFGIKYKFHLEDAVDCPEWVVPFHVFKALAEEYDLELVFAKNSHVLVEVYLKKPKFVDLMRKLGALGEGNQDQSTLSPDEWEVAYLYLAYASRKRGQPDQSRSNSRQDKGKLHLEKKDKRIISS